MNRIAIISILFGCITLTSGCIEVSYKTEARLTFGGKKEPTARPRIVDDGYPKTLPAVFASNENVYDNHSSYKSRPTISAINSKRKRGFTAFKRREK